MNKFFLVKRSICFVLLISFLISALSVIPSFAASEEYSLDYSDPNSDFNVSVSPSQLLSLLYPEEKVSTAEASFVDTYFEHVLLYNSDISPANVSVTVKNGTVNVRAKKHTYTAQNGSAVSWIPSSATYGALICDLAQSGSDYVCSFDVGDSTAVTVTYTCSLPLSSAFVNKLCNFAYYELDEATRISAEYSSTLEKYKKAKEDYETYLDACEEYRLQSELYEDYLSKKAAYDESLKEYNNYLSLVEKYDNDLKIYNEYEEKYQTYLAQKVEYEKKFAEISANNEAYKAYLVNLATIRSSMTAIESIYITPDNNVGTLYKALQNAEIIGMIERHQQKLIDFYGVKKSDIVAMRTASDALTEILIAYNEARETSEQEAFDFYKEHYHEISEKFNYLYDKMTTVLTKTIFLHVCTLLESVEYKNDPEMAEYKKWRIRNVLCHIYLICEALDDNATSHSTWIFYQDNGDKHTYDFSDLLAKNVIITDTNSSCPDNLTWQNGEDFEILELPEPPTRPDEVLKPTKPIEVEKPTEPTAVEKPVEPTSVSPAGDKPTLTEDQQNLIRRTASLSDAALTKRAMPQNNTVSFEKSIERPFSLDGSGTVAYYGHDGALLSVGTQPPTPTAPNHPQYVYEFFYWSLTDINGDKIYTPVFEAKKDEQKTYTVTFKASQSSAPLYTCVCTYGEIPEFKGETPTKASTNTEIYTFSGWYPQVMPTKGDVTYVAQFEPSERLYKVSWDVLGKISTKELAYGTTPTPPPIKTPFLLDNSYYKFLGWNRVISPVTKDVTYKASFSVIKLASGGENLTVTETADGYTVTADVPNVTVSGILAVAAAGGKDLKITLGDTVLKVSRAAVSSLKNNGAYGLSFISTLNADAESVDTAIGFRFVNSSGKTVNYSGDVYLSFSHGKQSTENLFLRYSVDGGDDGRTACSVNGARVEFVALPDRYYSVDSYHKIKLNCGEGGTAFTDSTLYAEGDYVTLKLLPNTEMVASKITVTDSNGSVTEITGTQAFYMPAGDVTVDVEFKTKTYKITFISNGEVVEIQEYTLGETVAPPDIPTSFEKDGYFYSFIGWDKPIGVVTDDETYTAKYNKIKSELKTEASTEKASQKVVMSHIVPLVIVGSIVLASLGGFTAMIIITLRKKK